MSRSPGSSWLPVPALMGHWRRLLMEPIQNQCFNNERGDTGRETGAPWALSAPRGHLVDHRPTVDPWWTPHRSPLLGKLTVQAGTHCHYRPKLLGSPGSRRGPQAAGLFALTAGQQCCSRVETFDGNSRSAFTRWCWRTRKVIESQVKLTPGHQTNN